MCAERDWRHCHREIIADYLVARGLAVVHLIDQARTETGALTPSAVPRADRTIVYPARQGELGDAGQLRPAPTRSRSR